MENQIKTKTPIIGKFEVIEEGNNLKDRYKFFGMSKNNNITITSNSLSVNIFSLV